MTLAGIAMLALVNLGQSQTRVVIYIDVILHRHQRGGIWELDPTGSCSVNSHVETNQLSVRLAKQEVSDVNDVQMRVADVVLLDLQCDSAFLANSRHQRVECISTQPHALLVRAWP